MLELDLHEKFEMEVLEIIKKTLEDILRGLDGFNGLDFKDTLGSLLGDEERRFYMGK